jgi:hypothetical protein
MIILMKMMVTYIKYMVFILNYHPTYSPPILLIRFILFRNASIKTI